MQAQVKSNRVRCQFRGEFFRPVGGQGQAQGQGHGQGLDTGQVSAPRRWSFALLLAQIHLLLPQS